MTKSVHDFTMKDIDGKDVSLSSFKGKTLLIVNVASRCGCTPQYKELESLHRKYSPRGFTVLGFPANDFLGQEPGTNAEIKNFCELNYKVSFPLFSKITVKGKDQHPLFAFLTSQGSFAGPVTWNFNKFLVDPSGAVIARFDSKVTPENPSVVKAIEQALPL